MSTIEWAEREVELACKREFPDWDGKLFDYGCCCYQSALKAYKSLCADGHSGMSWGFTKQILIRLMNSLPLTPIEGKDDEWSQIRGFNETEKIKTYQNARMSSLFKNVYEDGTVKYHDVDRQYCIDVDTGVTYSSWKGNVVDEIFPITMPYTPKVDRFKVFVKEFCAKGYPKDNEDYNTVAILRCRSPEGSYVEVNKHYADVEGSNKPVEITKEEYEERLKHMTESEK